MMTARTRLQHVIIAGAGLGGPALALSLARRSIPSTIYELRPAPSESGGSITLTPDALNAIRLGAGQQVYDRVRDTGHRYATMGMYDDTGYEYGKILVSQEEKGEYAVRIMRRDLQRALLDACDEAESVKIEWGKTMTSIEDDGKGVKVKFADGSSLTGDILIGADGVHSKVREYVLGDNTPLARYSGSCVVNGFVTASKVVKPTPGFTFPSVVLSPCGLLMTIPIDPKGQTLAWGITQELPDRSRSHWREYEVSGRACRDAKGQYDDMTNEPIRSLLDNVDDKSAKLWATYYIPELDKWYRGRVCLIGDAAHALPPNGQGSAMAFEDTVFLSRLLAESSDSAHPTQTTDPTNTTDTKGGATAGLERIFAHYQKNRRARVGYIRKVGKNIGGAFKSRTDPQGWGWWLKKWLIWGFVSVWSRGRVRMGRVDYELEKQDYEVI